MVQPEANGGNSTEKEGSMTIMSALAAFGPPQLLRTAATEYGASIEEDAQQQPTQHPVQFKHYDATLHDDCINGTGYYPSNLGRPQQCTWLLGSDADDPTNEERRMHSCAYHGDDMLGVSGLGRMY